MPLVSNFDLVFYYAMEEVKMIAQPPVHHNSSHVYQNEDLQPEASSNQNVQGTSTLNLQSTELLTGIAEANNEALVLSRDIRQRATFRTQGDQSHEEELQRHRPPMPRSNRLFVPPSFSSTSGTDLLEKELKECEISFAQRNAYQEVLIKVSNSLDTEQVHKLCCFSEEVSLNGRDNLNATTLIRLFEQKALISPASLEYLWLRLHTIGQSDLCGLIEQYARTYLDGQPALQPQALEQFHCPLQYGSQHSPTMIEQSPKSIQEDLTYSLPVQVVEEDDIDTIPNGNQVCDCKEEWEMMAGPLDYDRVQQLEEKQFQLQKELEQKDQVIQQHEMQLHQLQKELEQKDQVIQQHEMQPQNKNIKLFQVEQELQESNNEKEKLQQKLHDYEQRETLQEGNANLIAEKYLMKNQPHGIAIIINNSQFQSSGHELKDRIGSQIDSTNLHQTWKYLCYDPRVLENLTASDITRELVQISQQSHKDYDSFVCCILSHGYRDGVYGTDGKSVPIHEIAALFKSNFCPTLTNKPKLFFIQACRGDDEDKVVDIQKDGNNSDDVSRNFLPSEADFLFGYATPPGYASWRSPRYGSWYISELCKVLVENAQYQDLLTMLTMVNHKVSESYTTQGCKQCPSPVNQLRKQVWFFGSLK
ncbi:caspase-8-like isoform X2 [Dysidea avara]|uniref:caspase-8-like isoform X2 n=1 Tax=Dysidea avara TaxID=196820 RepID=UPI0033215402